MTALGQNYCLAAMRPVVGELGAAE
jgi:hypothetical protein